MTSLNIYINNNMNIEDIKVTSDDNMKSGKFGDVDNDVFTLALYNRYND